MVNLSKFRRSAPSPSDGASAAPSDRSAPARSAPAPRKPSVETYGRSCAPPPAGSSYWEFLHWASEGSMAFPEDTDLAIRLWMGSPPEDSGPSSPSPR